MRSGEGGGPQPPAGGAGGRGGVFAGRGWAPSGVHSAEGDPWGRSGAGAGPASAAEGLGKLRPSFSPTARHPRAAAPRSPRTAQVVVLTTRG
ncbi:hypothetical protein QJS66_16685 [Kocuria rhizophila]|nr:hypothetical protein QJS66_16685 [Kocuria rhizophila]